ncbi:uncharacterized protein [Halyomorpha halys]|uniref:uncharacterized protein n=1 Tax=Halyomorpha halys TaxID=286706 RepID=UPI0006D4EB07|nr:sericin-1-like [Halyomorpha halys]
MSTNHEFGSSGGSGHKFGSSVGSSHEFGSSGGSSHDFGSSGGSSHEFGSSEGANHEFGSSGGSSHEFGSSGGSSHEFGSSGDSGHSENFEDLTSQHGSGLDIHGGGFDSFGYDHEGSLGGYNQVSEFSSGLGNYGGSSGSGYTNGKSLGSSVVSVGHFNFDEHLSA